MGQHTSKDDICDSKWPIKKKLLTLYNYTREEECLRETVDILEEIIELQKRLAGLLGQMRKSQEKIEALENKLECPKKKEETEETEEKRN